MAYKCKSPFFCNKVITIVLALVMTMSTLSAALAQTTPLICGTSEADTTEVWEKMLEEILNGESQGAGADSIVVRLVYVTFPSTDFGPANSSLQNTLDAERATEIPETLAQMLEWQTKGTVDTRVEVVRRLDFPDSLWVADHPDSFYQTESLVEAEGQYNSCWTNPSDSFDFRNEFRYEILDAVGESYEAAQQDNPLFPEQIIVLVPNGHPWPNPGVAGETIPLRDGTLNCMGFPITSNSDEHRRTITAAYDPNWASAQSTAQIIYHELGHCFWAGAHLPGSCDSALSGSYCYEADPLERYKYGSYGIMRADLLQPGQGLGPMSYHMKHLGVWGDSDSDRWSVPAYELPAGIDSNTRRLKLYDLRQSAGQAIAVPTSDDLILVEDFGELIPGLIAKTYELQEFWISYHAGTNEDSRDANPSPAGYSPVYPSSGLMIWHIMSEKIVGLVYEDTTSVQTAVTSLDLESAWGRFDDPTITGPGSLPNPLLGYDNLDYWVGRDYGLWGWYRGSPLDFFSTSSDPDRQSEFSYRTNPSTFGRADFSSRRSAQSLENSVYVEILEESSDAGGPYAVIDVLRAPHEDISYPNGGETLLVGDPVTITWGNKRTWGWDYSQGNGFGTDSLRVIDTVDVYVDTGDSLYLVEAGVSNTGSYTWTPTPDHICASVTTHLVFHNVLEPDHTGVDESDEPFTVFNRLTLAEKSSASGINVQGLQPYSAIAFAVDESDSLDNPKLDLVISRIGGTAQVYENKSQQWAMSEFSPPTFTVFEGAAPPSGVRGLAAADVDNDGDVDFFAAAATNPRLYINQGPGSSPRFIDVADDNNLSSSAANSWGGTWADYDRDGWVDLYVNCAGGTATPTGITPGIDRLFQSQGIVNGVVDFLDTGASVGLSGGQNSTLSAAWGDADADGDLDLFVGFLPVDTASAGEHSILYLNDNDGTFSEIALENFISGGSGFPRIGYVSGAVWLDADRDGLMDLAISRQDPNPGPSTLHNNLEILRNLGAGEFDRSATIDLDAAITAKMQGFSVADLDLDGWPDLVAVPVSAGVAPPIMLNDISSASEFTNQASQLGIETGAAQGTVLADFNLDGDPDLYLGRSSNFFYQNVSQEEAGTIVSDEPDAAWVQIRLVSTTKGNNRMGIGARVTVDADGDSLISFVDGGSGRGGQTPGILTFGLGGYSGANVDAYVRWPDGYEQGPISANVGELKTITDDHSPSLIPSLVGLVAITRPGGLVDWQFHWYTDYSADISQDYVEIVNQSLTLHPGDTNVQHAVIPLATGGYRHELTWKNQSCVPGTTVQYKVGSAVYGSPAEESALKTTKIKVCVQ